ncbi:response regulator [Microbacterium foliorum]|uniref:Response regulator n=2 Tax=Microbacterium foliorum TaxID=104336 RepID=A0A4Y5YUG7_9MICO|nr:response regulator [Microbacterium foliorum]
MTVSIELVTMIVTVASTLLGLAAGFGWMITRTDARFEKFEQRVDARFGRLETDIAEVKTEIGEVKIAIARLEGPAPRLLVAR